MARWSEVQRAAPDFAARVQDRFMSYKHALLGTIRRSGYPRLTGIETQWVHGDLWMGMMDGSHKARDLLRNPRMALHSHLDAPDVATGDARITGRAEAVLDDERIAAWEETIEELPPGPFHLFRVDVVDVTLVRAAVDHLIVESWHEKRGFKEVERR